MALVDTITQESSNARHFVGERQMFGDGNEYIYVKASAAVAQYAACLVSETYTIAEATDTLSAPGAGAGKQVCVPQIALTSGYYGWALIKGTGKVKGAASCVKFTELTTSAAAGVLDDATTSGLEVVNGIALSETLVGAGAANCVLNYPSVGRTLA